MSTDSLHFRSKRGNPRRPVLHVAEILAWADEHRERTGKLPDCKSGAVAAKRKEKWSHIDQSLRRGNRGLPGGWSLAQLLTQRRIPRNGKRRRKYTLTKILEWADAHHRRTGRWPALNSGPIQDAPWETWNAVGGALILGARGLPGGSSLAKLLAERRGVRNRASTPELTVKQILRWADADRKRTGNWPLSISGPIRENPEETWCAVDGALKTGSRGLPRRSSLFRLLLAHRGVRRHTHCPPLSVARILEWADAHKKRTGNWPSTHTGPIHERPEESWHAVHAALNHGGRELPGGSSLSRLLLEFRGVRQHKRMPPLSVEQILRWADAHKRRTGRWPNKNSGPIASAAGETWRRVARALRGAKRDLAAGWSIAKLLAKHRGVHRIHSRRS